MNPTARPPCRQARPTAPGVLAQLASAAYRITGQLPAGTADQEVLLSGADWDALILLAHQARKVLREEGGR